MMVQKKLGPKEAALAAAFIVLILVVLTFYIWYQTESIRLGYKIGELQDEISFLKEEIKKLEAKKAALLSLGKIERRAREDLGLQDPGADQIIYEDFEIR
jgi:cell division protein FtsL